MKTSRNNKWFSQFVMAGVSAMLLTAAAWAAPITDWDDDGVSNVEESEIYMTDPYDCMSSVKLINPIDPKAYYGRALDMGKCGSGITLPVSERFQAPQGTIEMWVKPDQNPNAIVGGDLYSYDSGAIDARLVLSLVPSGDGGVKVQLDFGRNSIQSEATFDCDPTIAPPQWFHVAVTYNYTAKTAKLYIDGVLDSTIASPYVQHLPAIPVIARDFTCGYMDEFRFWTSERSEADIMSTKDFMVSPNAEFDTLVANYRFDDGGLSIEDFAHLPDFRSLALAGYTDDTDDAVVEAFKYRLTSSSVMDRNNDGHLDWVTNQSCSTPDPVIDGLTDMDIDGDGFVGDVPDLSDYSDYAIIRSENNVGDLQTAIVSGDDEIYVNGDNRIFILPGPDGELNTMAIGSDRVVAKATFARYLSSPESNYWDGLDNDGDGVADDVCFYKELVDLGDNEDVDDDGVYDRVEAVRSGPYTYKHPASIVVWKDGNPWGKEGNTRVTETWNELVDLISGGDPANFNMDDLFANTMVCAPHDDNVRLYGSLDLGKLVEDVSLPNSSRFATHGNNNAYKNFTLEFWVKDTVGDTDGWIFDFFNPETGWGYRLGLQNGAPRAEIYDRDGFIWAKAGGLEGNHATPKLAVDTWTHIAMVWSAASRALTLYRDGVSEIVSDPVQLVGDIDFGYDGSATIKKLDNVMIDEFRFWLTKRSQSAIETWKDKIVPATRDWTDDPDWNIDYSATTLPPLMAYYRFDDGGKTVEDFAYMGQRSYRLGIPTEAVVCEGAKAIGGVDDATGDDIPEWWTRAWGVSKWNIVGSEMRWNDWRNYIHWNNEQTAVTGIDIYQSGFTPGGIGSGTADVGGEELKNCPNPILSTDIYQVRTLKYFNLSILPKEATLTTTSAMVDEIQTIAVNGVEVGTEDGTYDVAHLLKIGRNSVVVTWRQKVSYTTTVTLINPQGQETNYNRDHYSGYTTTTLTVDGATKIAADDIWYYEGFSKCLMDVHSGKVCIDTFTDLNNNKLATKDGKVTVSVTNDLFGLPADADGDKLSLYYEYLLNTSPLAADSDNNGVTDFDEDFDGDTLKNGFELSEGLNPMNKDTDNDGYSDDEELAMSWKGTNWNDPGDHRALFLDGDPSSYLELPVVSRLALESWTIEAWVKPDLADANGVIVRRTINTLDEAKPVLNYEVRLIDGKLTLRFSAQSGDPAEGYELSVPDGYKVKADEWTHIAASYDQTSNKIQLYVNGDIAREGSAPITPITKACGIVSTLAGEGYVGMIDELRIWNMARTKADLEAARKVNLSGNEAGLVAYYRFDDVNVEKREAINGPEYAYLKHAADSCGASRADWLNSWRNAAILRGNAMVIPVDPESDPLGQGVDTDGDGMPDEWEIKYGLDPTNPEDAWQDLDGDGLVNYYEYLAGTDPTSTSTNGVELDDVRDSDGDGLSNIEEQVRLLHPGDKDTDDDGCDDMLEVVTGTNPNNSLSQVKDGALATIKDIAKVFRMAGTNSMTVEENAGNTGSQLTIAFWVNFSELPADEVTFLKRTVSMNTVNTYNYKFALGTDGNLTFGVMNYGNVVRQDVKSTEALEKDTWYYVIGRIDQATNKIVMSVVNVKNSKVEDIAAYTRFDYSKELDMTMNVDTNAKGNLLVGKAANGDVEWTGTIIDIDNLYIWQRVLSDAEVADLYEKSPSTVGMSCRFLFDDGGKTAEDFCYPNDWQREWKHAGVMAPMDAGNGVNYGMVLRNDLPRLVVDTDNDGIDDWWEISQFGDLTTADDTTDYDGDGLLDIYEFIMGYNPKNPVSVPRTFYAELEDGSYVQVTQTTENGDFIDGEGNPVAVKDADTVAKMTDGEVDYDGDGISNADETEKFGTRPDKKDTDGDGIDDWTEINVTHTDPLNPFGPYENRVLDLVLPEHEVSTIVFGANGRDYDAKTLVARTAPYAVVDNFDAIKTPQNFTMAFWFKLESGDTGTLIQKTAAKSTQAGDFRLYLDGGVLKLDYAAIGAPDQSPSSQTRTYVFEPTVPVDFSNGWNHVTVAVKQLSNATSDYSYEVKMYVVATDANGKLVEYKEPAIKTTRQQLGLLRDAFVLGDLVVGDLPDATSRLSLQIDELAFWNDTKSAKAMGDIRHCLLKTANTDNLAVYYSFDDGTEGYASADMDDEDEAAVMAMIFMGDDAEGEDGLACKSIIPSRDKTDDTYEYLFGDSDDDGIADIWEVYYFGNTDGGADDDQDEDGLGNYYEWLSLADPTRPYSLFERYGLGTAETLDGDQDCDGDGLTNREENQNGTDPMAVDTDDDGVSDKVEIVFGSSPVHPASVCIWKDGTDAGSRVELSYDEIMATFGNLNEAAKHIKAQAPDALALNLADLAADVELYDADRFAVGEGSFTVEFWIKSNTTGDVNVIDFRSDAPGGYGFKFGLRNGAPYGEINSDGGIIATVGGSDYSPVLESDTWTHLAFNWQADNKVLWMYRDVVSAMASTPVTSTVNFEGNGGSVAKICATADSVLVDEFRFWACSRSERDLSDWSDMLIPAPLTGEFFKLVDLDEMGIEYPLKAYYRFDDGGLFVEDFANFMDKDYMLDVPITAAGAKIYGYDDVDGDALPDWWTKLWHLDTFNDTRSTMAPPAVANTAMPPAEDGEWSKYLVWQFLGENGHLGEYVALGETYKVVGLRGMQSGVADMLATDFINNNMSDVHMYKEFRLNSKPAKAALAIINTGVTVDSIVINGRNVTDEANVSDLLVEGDNMIEVRYTRPVDRTWPNVRFRMAEDVAFYNYYTVNTYKGGLDVALTADGNDVIVYGSNNTCDPRSIWHFTARTADTVTNGWYDVQNSGIEKDPDGDKLPNYYEYLLGTNPRSISSNGNIPDADADYDGDGKSNLYEVENKLDPTQKDTDNDGISDGDECAIPSDPADWNDPEVHRTLVLDGTEGCYLLLPKQTRFALNTWTIEAQIKLASLPAAGEYAYVIRRVVSTLNDDVVNYGVAVDENGYLTVYFTDANGTPITKAYTGEAIEVGKWTHVAASFDGNAINMYLNGDLKAQRYINVSPLNTGCGLVDTKVGEGFVGNIDDLRIWNTICTKEDIFSLYNHTLNGDEAGLVAYYRFDDMNLAGRAAIYGADDPRCSYAADSVSGSLGDWNNYWRNVAVLKGTATVAEVESDDDPLSSLLIDTDNDGLPDAWELKYFGNLDQDGDGDPDGDGLTNKYEYLAGTDPTRASTDNETNDYMADSDGDGISNGQEQTLGTDPGRADTDDDGCLDQDEIAYGTDPAQSLSQFDPIDHHVMAYDEINRVLRLIRGTTMTLANSGDNTGKELTIGFWFRPSARPANDVTFMKRTVIGQGNAKVFNYEIAYTIDAQIRLTVGTDNGARTAVLESYGDGLTAGQWVYVTVRFSEAENLLKLDLAKADDSGEAVKFGYYDFEKRPIYAMNIDSAETGKLLLGNCADSATEWNDLVLDLDNLYIWDHMLSDEQVAGLTTGQLTTDGLNSQYLFDDNGNTAQDFRHKQDWLSLPRWAHAISIAPEVSFTDATGTYVNHLDYGMVLAEGVLDVMTDSDGDGLPDAWEINYFGNLDRDGEGDYDGDGLTDRQEFQLGTNPTEKDTDHNGISDFDEDNDGDTLSNGYEFQLGIDPNNRDTDNDGIADNVEISKKTSPADWNDPGTPKTLNLDGWSYVQMPNLPKYAANTFTVEAWVNPTMDEANGIIFMRAVDVESDSAIVHYMVYLEDGYPKLGFFNNGGDAIEIYTPGMNPLKGGEWSHVAVTFDNESGNAEIYVNGLRVFARNAGVRLIDAQGKAVDPGAGVFFQGKLDEIRLWDGVRTAEEIFDNMNVYQTVDEEEGDEETGAKLIAYFRFDDVDFAGRAAIPDSEGVTGENKKYFWYAADSTVKADWENKWSSAAIIKDADVSVIELVDPEDDPMEFDDTDSDGDGLPDWWEIKYFGDITSQDGEGDPDGDGLKNLYEYLAGTDPTEAFTDGVTSDFVADSDGDGLSNGTEQNLETHPGSVDTDDDGWNDDEEQFFGSTPAQSLSQIDEETLKEADFERIARILRLTGPTKVSVKNNAEQSSEAATVAFWFRTSTGNAEGDVLVVTDDDDTTAYPWEGEYSLIDGELAPVDTRIWSNAEGYTIQKNASGKWIIEDGDCTVIYASSGSYQDSHSMDEPTLVTQWDSEIAGNPESIRIELGEPSSWQEAGQDIQVATDDLDISVGEQPQWTGRYVLEDASTTGSNRIWSYTYNLTNTYNWVAYNATSARWELSFRTSKSTAVAFYAVGADQANLDPWDASLTWTPMGASQYQLNLAQYFQTIKAETTGVTFLRRTVIADNGIGTPINYAFTYSNDKVLTFSATLNNGSANVEVSTDGDDLELQEDTWYYVVGRIDPEHSQLILDVVECMVDERDATKVNFKKHTANALYKNTWTIDNGARGELQIGSNASDGGWATGLVVDLDNLYIWNATLADQEVSNLYTYKFEHDEQEHYNTGIRQENLVSTFLFDDNGKMCEDFQHAKDWLRNWKHAGKVTPLNSLNHVVYGMIRVDEVPGNATDSDNDGLPDAWEIKHFGSLIFGSDDDPDGDGLTNREELRCGTDPLNPDSDNDGMSDGYEYTHGFDPNKAADGLADDDDDGLTNAQECFYGTDPFNYDTDGDGLPDKFEVDNGYILRGQHLNRWLDPNPSITGAGFLKAIEVGYVTGDTLEDAYQQYLHLTGPDGDPDGDGLTNAEELLYETDPLIYNRLADDVDGDGLSNDYELDTADTNPVLVDTDDDEYDDLAEWASGFDPLASSDKPSLNWVTGGGWAYEGNLVGNLKASHGYLTVPSAGDRGRLALGTWTIEARIRVRDIIPENLTAGQRVYVLRRAFVENEGDECTADTPFNYAIGLEFTGEKSYRPFVAFRAKNASKEQIVRSVKTYDLEDVDGDGYYNTATAIVPEDDEDPERVGWIFVTGLYNPSDRRMSLYVDGQFNTSTVITLANNKGGQSTDIVCPTSVDGMIPVVRIGENIPTNGDDDERQPRLQVDEIRVWGVAVENRVLTTEGELASFVLASDDIMYGANNQVVPSKQVFDNSLGNRYLRNAASMGGQLVDQATYTVDLRLDENDRDLFSGVPGTPIYVQFHKWNNADPNRKTPIRGDTIWVDLDGYPYLSGDEQIIAGPTSWDPAMYPRGLPSNGSALIYYYDYDNSGSLTKGDYFWVEWDDSKYSKTEPDLQPWAKAMGMCLYLKFDDGGGSIEDYVWRNDWNSSPRRFKHAIRPVDLPGIWPPTCGKIGGHMGEDNYDYAYVTSFFKLDAKNTLLDPDYAWVISLFSDPSAPVIGVTAISNAPDVDPEDGVVDSAYVPENGNQLEYDILTAVIDESSFDPECGELEYRYYWLYNTDYPRNADGVCEELFVNDDILYELRSGSYFAVESIVGYDKDLDLFKVPGITDGDTLQLAVVAVTKDGRVSDVSITRQIDIEFSTDEYGVLKPLKYISFTPAEPVLAGKELTVTLQNLGPKGTVYIQWYKNLNLVGVDKKADVGTDEQVAFKINGSQLENGDVWSFKAYIRTEDRVSRSIPPTENGGANWIFRRIGEGCDENPDDMENKNQAPSMPTEVVITPEQGRLYAGSVIHATAYGSKDPDGDVFGYYYQWYLNGSPIAGQTMPYLDSSVSLAENDELRCGVYAMDIYGNKSGIRMSEVTMVMGLGATSGGSSTGNFEPNDSWLTATPIVSKTSLSTTSDSAIQIHNFYKRDDVDWITFVVNEGRRIVYFETNDGTMFTANKNKHDENGPATVLTLYASDIDGKLVERPLHIASGYAVDTHGNTPNGVGETHFGRFTLELDPGIYYVRIDPKSRTQNMSNNYYVHLFLGALVENEQFNLPTWDNPDGGRVAELHPHDIVKADGEYAPPDEDLYVELHALAKSVTDKASAIKYYYIWYRNGEIVPFGGHNVDYKFWKPEEYFLAHAKTSDPDIIPSDMTSSGDVWYCEVYAKDSNGLSAPAVTNAVHIGTSEDKKNEWRATLTSSVVYASKKNITSTVTIGWAKEATFGYDAALDVALPPLLMPDHETGETVRQISDMGMTYSVGYDNMNGFLSTDIHPAFRGGNWYVVVEMGTRSFNDSPDRLDSVVLSWPELVMPAGSTGSLTITRMGIGVDGVFQVIPNTTQTIMGGEAGSIELTEAEINALPVDKFGQRCAVFRISLGGSDDMFTMDLKSGWNMVSLPITPMNNSVYDVFSVADKSVFSGNVYMYENGKYVVATHVIAGRGYWLYCTKKVEDLVLYGSRQATEVPLSEGWNVVGPIYDILGFKATYNKKDYPGILKAMTGSVDGDGLQIFEFDSNTGNFIDTSNGSGDFKLKVGKGYWIYSRNAVNLPVVNNSAVE